jgi:serine protease
MSARRPHPFTLFLLIAASACLRGDASGGIRAADRLAADRSSGVQFTDLRSSNLRSNDLRSLDLRPRHDVQRQVPVAPDVVIVKRGRRPGTLKAEGPEWRNALKKSGALSIRPMFPTHVSDGTSLSGIDEVTLAAGTDVWKASAAFYEDPSVEWAEPLFARKIDYTPNDPMLSMQWHLDKMHAKEAWDVSRNSKAVVIAIVDNGTDAARQDLAADIWTNPGETPNNGLDDDRNGFIDDVHGWDFGNKDNDPKTSSSSTSDNRWHGTGTAATAAAVSDNGIGIASPSFNATIMPVKVARDQDPESIYGYNGIVYAADNGADIINCSWGGASASFAEADVITHAVSKGALVVASAGNDDSEGPSYPAGLKGVLSVAATDDSDRKTSFSNYGYNVDVCAPGEAVYTAWGDGYQWVSGTSFSAPLTAGTAALVKGFHPSWTGIQAGEQVRATADPIDAANQEYAGKLGSGRVNAYRAMSEKPPAIRVETVQFQEGDPSNGNSLFDPGEEVLLTFTLKNILESAHGVQIQFTSQDPDVTFTNAVLSVGSLSTSSTWTNSGNPVRIRLGPGVERGTKTVILARITANGGYADRDVVKLDVSSSFATLKAGNARFTVSSIGRLGSADTDLNEGEGFVFGTSGNLLFEGGFMAAVSADSVSDVVRGLDDVQDRDFKTVPGGEIVVRQVNGAGDEQGSAVFTDEAASKPLHLGVVSTAYAFQNAPDKDYILIAYRLYNCWDRPIRNLYAGLFMDWDIEGDADATSNLGGFDPDLNLAYIDEPVSKIHGGLMIFSEGNQVNYKLNHNYTEPFFGTHYEERGKWQDLSGGVQERNVTAAGDYSHVMGIGPVTVNPGDTVLFGCAVLGGSSLADLKTSAISAAGKWEKIQSTSAGEPTGPISPLRFSLEDNFPNPFNPETSIGYTLAERSTVRLSIVDVNGRETARLVDAAQEPGRHRVKWNGMVSGSAAPSGVYFCTLRAGIFVRTIKMLLLR